ncbi:hypothetical protein [Paenibacillus sp. 1P07SE]|uniref:hypothetical protein n=1 Tax=Paenibacillus sp. 1P07SE TaxID=3132209 RepID=UPI0039A41CE8
MIQWFRRRRRQKQLNKVKPGDGSALKPFRIWELLTRSLFYAKLKEEDGEVHLYAVNVDFLSDNSPAELYRDGKLIAMSGLPVAYRVPGGVIEVAITLFGLKRMHYVMENEEEHVLYPDRKTAEGLRLALDKHFPRTSKGIGVAAVVILLLLLVLGLPQLAASISQIPFVSDNIGSFELPFVMPDWVNVTLTTAGVLAAVERALMLKNHWLVDMDSNWWGA